MAGWANWKPGWANENFFSALRAEFLPTLAWNAAGAPGACRFVLCLTSMSVNVFDGVKTRVSCIKPVPKTKRELKSFVGLTGFFRQYIPCYRTLGVCPSIALISIPYATLCIVGRPDCGNLRIQSVKARRRMHIGTEHQCVQNKGVNYSNKQKLYST